MAKVSDRAVLVYQIERRSRSDCVHEQVAKQIVNVRFTKKEHLLRETSQKSRLHSPAQIIQKHSDDVIKL